MSARAAPASMTTRHKAAHRIADRVLFNFLLSLYGRSRLNRNANRRPRCGDRSGAILQEALSAASGSAVAYSAEAAGTAIAVKVSAAVTAAKVREGETRRGIDGGFGGVTRHVRLRRRVLCRSYRRKSAVRETPRGIDGGFGERCLPRPAPPPCALPKIPPQKCGKGKPGAGLTGRDSGTLLAASGSAVAYFAGAAGTAIAVKASAAVTAAKVREGKARRGIDGGFGGVACRVRLCRSRRGDVWRNFRRWRTV